MRKDRHLAIQLRRQKKSYNEISNVLGVPKSTLHVWFKNNQWSLKIKEDLTKKARILAKPKLRLMAMANKKKWEKIHTQFQDKAKKEFTLLIKDPLFVAGLMLYWGEGDKVLKNCLVRLSNSDPELIKVFYLFLKNVLLISKEKIFIKLILYPELEDLAYKKSWSNKLNIPLSQFKKSAIILGKHPTKRLSLGICSIEVSSRKIKEKIITWFALYQKYISEKYIHLV
ncbi:hypothetical protein HYS95_03875 [Candidatus Daviesbacteria bacterium]|nr:hypothetical protein [Candidatus Daviesbacteria bacterium]